jgi:hypothetical protein
MNASKLQDYRLKQFSVELAANDAGASHRRDGEESRKQKDKGQALGP